jgi:G3E family GTPase
MKTKADIISGFLGAGKTTLIKKLIVEKLQTEKVVIIENEFGEIGIDGNILKNSGIEVREINSGCICCTLMGDFGKAIQEVVAKYKPHRLIIEPSGVGKLSDILKACEAPEVKDLVAINAVITVVDILKYQIYISNFGEFYENQIKNARTIILSRTRNADNKKLETVTGNLRKLNPNAKIITTPWESLKAEKIIAVAEEDVSLSLEYQMKEIKNTADKNHSHQEGCKCGCCNTHTHDHTADDFFEVWSTETPKTYRENDLKDIMNFLGNEKTYGMILRAKGILQTDSDKWVQFDYVPGEFKTKNTMPDYTGRLCIIGKNLNTGELKNLFGIKG